MAWKKATVGEILVVLNVGPATRGAECISRLFHRQQLSPDNSRVDFVVLVRVEPLESNRMTRVASERRQALHRVTGYEAIVAAVQFGHCFLDQWHPELFATRFRVQQIAVAVTRKHVVHDHSLPLAIVTQSHEIAAVLAVVFCDEDFVEKFGLFEYNSQSTQEPAVAQKSLLDVAELRIIQNTPV